ncbi:MAG: hypothetical protein EXQ86_11630 [Rhodospirillales bacterium]|nr:hypothetical protein [Rhodospirillales bacterium]
MPETFRRLALIVVGTDEVSEVDYHLFLPEGVVFHTARLKQARNARMGTRENFDMLIGSLEETCRSAALANPELLVFSCTSASFFLGKGWDLELAGRMTAATGIPAVTTSTAVCEALRAFGAKKTFMVSPYPEHLNAIELDFFKANGLPMDDHYTFALKESREVASLTPSRIRKDVLALRDRIRGFDTLLLSCTGIRAMETAQAIEDVLGLPVVTSNTATMWAALGRMGITAPEVGAGRLFGLTYSRATASAAE